MKDMNVAFSNVGNERQRVAWGNDGGGDKAGRGSNLAESILAVARNVRVADRRRKPKTSKAGATETTPQEPLK